MTAATAQPPGRPALDTAELFEPDRRDWLRLLGGVLLAAGAVVLYVRKFEAWGEFAKLLVVLIPFVVLYGLGWLSGTREREPGAHDGAEVARRPEGWAIVFLILGTVLSGLVIAQLLLTLGADNLEARLHQVLIGLGVAGAAYAASFLRHIPFLSLVGGLAALWAWIFLWDKIVEIDKIGTGRALLLIFAALLLAAGIFLRQQGRPQAADFITVAGITAILAGLLSVSQFASEFDPVGDEETKPSEIWNVFILIVSLALVAYGSKAPSRGPSYVGGFGLLTFVGLVGANVVALANGNFDDREKLAGWPLLLLFLGIAALAASFFLPREGVGGRGPAGAPGGVPGGPPGQQTAPGGYPPPGQATQVQPQPPRQPEQWPPPGQAPGSQQQTQQYPQQQPPAQGGPPPGDQTVARPIPPPPPNDPGQQGR